MSMMTFVTYHILMCIALWWFTVGLGGVCLDIDKISLLLICKLLPGTDQTLLDSMFSREQEQSWYSTSEMTFVVLFEEVLEAGLAYRLLEFSGNLVRGSYKRKILYILLNWGRRSRIRENDMQKSLFQDNKVSFENFIRCGIFIT